MMRIMNWMSNNKTGVGLIVVAAIALIGISLSQGCNIGDVIKVKVPDGVQEVTNVPDMVSLNDAEYVRAEYVDSVNRDIERFDAAIEKSVVLRNFFTDALNMGITFGSDAAAGSGLPLGGFLALVFGGLGGLFLEKPGSRARQAESQSKAEQRSYGKGQEHFAEKLAMIGLNALTGKGTIGSGSRG